MFCYVKLDETQIAAIEAEIEKVYLEKFGRLPDALVYAIAHESFAAKIREKCAAQEVEKAKMLG